MDIYHLRKQVKDRICLIGNISVDTFPRGNNEEIGRLVKDRICNIGYKGAYCIGSSKPIPKYLPPENYRTFVAADMKYGRIK